MDMTNDPADRMRVVREYMAREGAKRPTDANANGYSETNPPGWQVPPDAPNVTGHPPAEPTDVTEALARGEAVAGADILAAAQARDAPRNPAPDPSQGVHGTVEPSIDAQIREAQARGDFRTVITLQHRKHGADRPPRGGRNNPYWNGPSAA